MDVIKRKTKILRAFIFVLFAILCVVIVQQYKKCFIDYSKYNTQNADAHTLYTAAVSTPETLRQKGIEVPENLAIVSGKCENDSFEFLFQQELTGLLVRAECI